MLQRCLSVAAIRQALSTEFPKDLEGTYDRILDGIQPSFQPDALRILQALIATTEPLNADEIVDILAVDLISIPPRFEPDARLIDPRSTISVCSSLIITNTISQPDFYGRYKPATALRLAHASVAEYFATPKPAHLTHFQFSVSSARKMLGQACLAYLMAPDFGDINNKTKVLKNLELYPLLRHAAQNWPSYVNNGCAESKDYMDDGTKALVQAFFATHKMPNGGNFAFWVGLLIPEAPPHRVANTQPLYYAASFGLLEVTQLLLDTEKDIDIEALGGRHNSSALHVAVYRNHIEVVKLLLAHGANPNVSNCRGETALFFAVLIGNSKMIQLLRDYGTTALNQAHLDEIQELVSEVADEESDLYSE